MDGLVLGSLRKAGIEVSNPLFRMGVYRGASFEELGLC